MTAIADDATEIRDLIATFQAALNSADPDLAAACYTPDGVFMPSGAPTARGDEIRETYDFIFQHIRLELDFAVSELLVGSESWAYAITNSRGWEQDLATGARRPDSNRELFLLTRSNGAWKISCLMFNKTD